MPAMTVLCPVCAKERAVTPAAFDRICAAGTIPPCEPCAAQLAYEQGPGGVLRANLRLLNSARARRRRGLP